MTIETRLQLEHVVAGLNAFRNALELMRVNERNRFDAMPAEEQTADEGFLCADLVDHLNAALGGLDDVVLTLSFQK